MKDRISPKDWEAISAYLDGQLSQYDRLGLENRFQTEKDLNAACTELRIIRKLLHSQPKIEAPKNFLLTPEMVRIKSGGHRTPSAFPALRMAAILATVLFVVVFLGDLAAQVTHPAPLMLAQAPAQEAELPPYGTPDGRGGGGGEEEALEMYGAPQAEQPAEAVDEQENIMMTQTDSELMEGVEIETQDQKSAQPLSIATPTLVPSVTAASLSGYPMPEDLSKMVYTAPYEVPSTQTSYQYPPTQAGWDVMDWIKFALALVAVVTGMAAYLLKRRRDN